MKLFGAKRKALILTLGIGGILAFMGVVGYIMWLVLAHQAQMAHQSPQPLTPDLPSSVSVDSTSKTDQYREELEEQSRSSSQRDPGEEAWEEMGMRFSDVYAQAKADTATIPPPEKKVESLVAPRPTRRRQPRRRYEPPKPVAKPEPKPNPFIVETHPLTKEDTEQPEVDAGKGQFVRAVFVGKTKVRPGEIIEVLLLEPVALPDLKLPENTMLPAQVKVKGNRIFLNVGMAVVNRQIISLEANCYDLHYIPGLGYGGKQDHSTEERVTRRARQDVRRGVPGIPYLKEAVEGVADAVSGIRRNRRGRISFPDHFQFYLHISSL